MYKTRICKICGKEYRQYNSFQKCPCVGMKLKTPLRKTKIKPVSDKRKVQDAEYQLKRVLFLKKPENQICPITGQQTTDLHHMRGRIGDLLLDERYWLALSREGHKKVEENPVWAKENGYSLSRLEKDQF